MQANGLLGTKPQNETDIPNKHRQLGVASGSPTLGPDLKTYSLESRTDDMLFVEKTATKERGEWAGLLRLPHFSSKPSNPNMSLPLRRSE